MMNAALTVTRTKAAVARLRSFRPPAFPLWDRLPLSRRAAVLVLLYADRAGDLRVVLTMRAASLRNFSGHAAFPGGKADSLDETPYQIARREAWEEIGLPADDARLPGPFRIEALCQLPCSLAKTELAVRPCVALLRAEGVGAAADAGEQLVPRLDAREVAAVFSAPFHNFLRATDEVAPGDEGPPPPPGAWYEGSWTHWHEQPWRMHYFYVPVHGQRVARPRRLSSGKEEQAEEEKNKAEDAAGTHEAAAGRFKVWGMTARILVDTATLAYGETPAFEHNSHFGDEKMIEGLAKMGRLAEKKMPGSELTHKDLKEASKM